MRDGQAQSGGGESRPSQLAPLVAWLSRGIAVALMLWALADDALIGGGPGFGVTQAAVFGVGLLLLGSSFAPLGWNARALALVLSMGFVVVVGEVGVRVLFSYRYKRPYQLDERALYSLVPGSMREHILQPENGGDRILYRINRDGYRGEELEADPRLRIAVYGDSFIQGEFSVLEETFTERLEAHVSERLGFPVEVVNAGVAGYGPDQALRKLESEVDRLEPDLVVMAVFAGNDFGDLVRNKLFRVDDAGGLVDTNFTIAPDQRRGLIVRDRELVLKRVVRDAVHALAAMAGIRQPAASAQANMTPVEKMDFFLENRLREYEEFIVEGDEVVHELHWDSYDADVSLMPRSPAARYKVQLMSAVLRRMKDLLAERGIPMVLLPIPHPIDVGGHATGEVDRARYPDYTPRGLVGALDEIAAEIGVPVIDLFSTYDALGSKAVYFQGGDDHWNARGQEVAGELVAEFLTTRGLLDASQASGQD